MAAQPKSILKSYLETADKPTQQQFWDLIDTMRSELEGIPAGDITGLFGVIDDRIAQVGGGGGGGDGIVMKVPLTVSGSDSYELAAEVLAFQFLVIPVTNGPVLIGTNPGLGDIYQEVGVANQPIILDYINFSTTARTLHFTGSFVLRFMTVSYA